MAFINNVTDTLRKEHVDDEINAFGNFTSSVPKLHLIHPEYVAQIKFICESVLKPPVCFLGILGNGLSLCVLTRREMAAATTCFLAAMAMSDLLHLVMQLPTLFQPRNGIDSNYSTRVFFQGYTILLYCLNNVFITCTSWLTVSVATERIIALRCTPSPRLVCNTTRARITVIVIFILSFAFHFSKFFEYKPNPDHTSTQPLIVTDLATNSAYETYLHVANIALAGIIPVFLLIVINSFLVHFLAKHQQRMHRHKGSTSLSMSSVNVVQISAIVAATILAFIACHSVGVFLALTIASKGRLWIFNQPAYIALKYINNLLVLVNPCLNFILYYTISRKFRKTLIATFCACCVTRLPVSPSSPGQGKGSLVATTESIKLQE